MATVAVRAPATGGTKAAPSGLILRRALRVGMVGGVANVYMAATGITQRFRAKPIITDVLDLGYAMVLMVLLLTGYLATRVRDENGEPVEAPVAWRLASGAIAGAVAGGFLAVFVLIFSAIDVRQIFINISPDLIQDTLSFGQSAPVGALLLIAIGAAIGTLGAALTFLRPPDRRMLLAGLIAVVTFGLLEQLFRVMIDTLLQDTVLSTDWLYTGGGLTTIGAVIIFILAAAIAFVVTRRERLFAGIMATEEDDAGGGRGRLLDRVALWTGLVAAAIAIVLAGIGIASEEPSEAVPVSIVLVVLVISIVGLILGSARSRPVRTTGARRGLGTYGYAAAAVALAAILPLIAQEFLSNALVRVMIYVLLGLGLNIVVGLAGLLDLGYVAFFAIGAYGMGLLTSPVSGLVSEGIGTFGQGALAGEPITNFWIALPFVVLAALIFGILLGAPVVRLRGDYLAIVTLGFGEIIRVIVQSDWTKNLLGGSQGLKQIPGPPPVALDLTEPQKLYYLVFIASLLMAYVTWRLQYSRVGRAWAAMREDESVAEGMGISVIRYKLLAFAIGAAVASLGGIFFAVQISVTTPESFGLLVSIQVLAVIILGGIGSVTGVIVGAVVLIALPELLREFAEYQLLFYGAALVAIMLLRPEGLVPNVRRRRELHERQAEEAQFAGRVGAGGTEPEVTATRSEERQTSQREERME